MCSSRKPRALCCAASASISRSRAAGLGGDMTATRKDEIGVQLERMPSVVGVDPNYLLGQAGRMATALAKVVQKQQLYKMISGRKYIVCEGWTTLAAMNGVTPHEVSVTEEDGFYVATVELRRMSDGQVIARASAECGAPDELDRQGKPVWSTRPRYAGRSMALTRATAKACRLAFSWIVALAGMNFAVTPAEEVPEGGFGDEPKTGRVADTPASAEPDVPAPGLPGAPAALPADAGESIYKGRALKDDAAEQLLAVQREVSAVRKRGAFAGVQDAIDMVRAG